MRRKHVKRVYLKKQRSNQGMLTPHHPSPSLRRRSLTEQLPIILEPPPLTTLARDTHPTHRDKGLILYPDNSSRHIHSSKYLRRLLRGLSGINAVISWVVSVLGYEVIKRSGAEDSYKAAICVLSAIQIVLVVWYSSTFLNFLERLRLDLRLSPTPVLALCQSRDTALLCALECCYHLLVLPMQVRVVWQVNMLGVQCTLSLDDFLYVLLLLRNYHTLRLLFWCSPLSTNRAYLFAKVVDVQFTSSFVARAYLATYSLKLIVGIYAAIVVVSGVSVYVFEKGVSRSAFDIVENGLWLVAYSQTTVGYGEATPRTYFGCMAVLFSCIIGTFLLSLIVGQSSRVMYMSMAEASLYTEIVYSNRKRQFTRGAVVFIQNWWRMMYMRLHRTRNAPTIVNFYSNQGKYRGVIQACQRVKDRRFEWQIEAFRHSVAKECRQMTEYLQPVLVAASLVSPIQTTDIIRAEYNIKEQIKEICREFKRYRDKVQPPNSISSSTPSVSRQTSSRAISPQRPLSGRTGLSTRSESKEMAKAKAKAQKKLIGRLLREDVATPNSEQSTIKAGSAIS